MNNDQRQFLSLPRFSALLLLFEACRLLGLALHHGKILVAKGMLVPAGKRRRRKGRIFASGYILELVEDRAWLDKAKDTLSTYWEEARSRKRESQV